MYSNKNVLAAVAAFATAVSAGQWADEHHHGNGTVTKTKVVEKFTTYCPEPTVFTVNGKVYDVEEPTTIIVDECPCTVVEPCLTCPPTNGPSKPTNAPAPPPTGGDESGKPPGGETPPGGEKPPGGGEEKPPVSGADVKSDFGVFALIGAGIAGMLAL